MNAIQKHLDDFLSLFFPELCAGCGTNLVNNESAICSKCIHDLPYTYFHHQTDNPAARQFWGRIPFLFCGSFLYFRKGSIVQEMLHQLKYNNKPEVGFRLGEMYGMQLQNMLTVEKPDLIIPIPLHPSRQRKRGYNQSDYFAAGLSATLNIPADVSNLQRSVRTDSQTHKSRFTRYENMKDVFFVKNRQVLEKRHVLLIDDIITTGATIESAALALLDIPGLRISIAAIAFTN